MKKQTNAFIFLLLLSTTKLFSQVAGADTISKDEYLVDDVKLGTISYAKTAMATRVTVLLRKGKNMHTGVVERGIVFTGSIAEPANADDNPVFCFIGQEELDDAIRALQFINDSLLTGTPDHDIEYTYNFPNSPAQFFVYYDIYFADRKPKWSIVFDFDRNLNDTNWITVENKDCASLIDLFKTAMEKLKNY